MLEIAVLWLVNNEKELMLSKRSMTKKFHPGEWGPTMTGTAEEGETPEQTLAREAEEELGLVPVKAIVHWKSDYNSPNVDWDKGYDELKAYGEDLPVLTLGEGEFKVIVE